MIYHLKKSRSRARYHRVRSLEASSRLPDARGPSYYEFYSKMMVGVSLEIKKKYILVKRSDRFFLVGILGECESFPVCFDRFAKMFNLIVKYKQFILGA